MTDPTPEQIQERADYLHATHCWKGCPQPAMGGWLEWAEVQLRNETPIVPLMSSEETT